jgi:hypothetical protein
VPRGMPGNIRRPGLALMSAAGQPRVNRGLVVAAALVLTGAVLGWRSTQGSAPGRLAKSTSGRDVRWKLRDITLVPSEPHHLSPNVLTEALAAAAETWNGALGSCNGPKLRLAPLVEKPRGLVRDGVTAIVVREDRWCPDRPRDPDDCNDPEQAGITHLYPSDPDEGPSELYEADIELNGVNYHWSLDGEQAGTRSLRALVVHELGHVLGLDHPCVLAPAPGKSAGLPPCTGELRGAVMYPMPVEAGREPVLGPTAGEVKTLCALYR